jgi:hypothetical protein
MLGLACPGQWGRSCERDVSGEGPDRAMRSVDSGCGTGGVAAVVMVVVCCSVDGERNWHAAAVSQESLPAGARRAALSLMGKQPTQQNIIGLSMGSTAFTRPVKAFMAARVDVFQMPSSAPV